MRNLKGNKEMRPNGVFLAARCCARALRARDSSYGKGLATQLWVRAIHRDNNQTNGGLCVRGPEARNVQTPDGRLVPKGSDSKHGAVFAVRFRTHASAPIWRFFCQMALGLERRLLRKSIPRLALNRISAS